MSYRILSWFLIVFACFNGIGSYPLLDDNEGMYAAIARDMLQHGQWIIPHLNGVPYIEKPPMLYWLMALSMSVFGVQAAAVRLVPSCAVLATAWMIKRFVQRQTSSEATGFGAALILVTSLTFLTMARMILCDMVMTCFLTAAIMQFYGWYTGQDRRRLLAFYVLLALAVLTKGFVTVILAGGTITTFMVWNRAPRARYCQLLSPMGILIFLLIAAPWHIAASMQEPGFAWFYFINEHLNRFLNTREPHDYYTGDFWYYLPRILAYLLPWSMFMMLLPTRVLPAEKRYPQVTQLLWSWFLFLRLVFSACGAKANYYMITGMPPLVMLVALQIKYHTAIRSREVRNLASGSLVLILEVLWLLQHFCREGSGDMYSTCKAISEPSFISATLYAGLAILLCWRIPQRWLAPMLGTNIALVMPLLIAGANIADDLVSQKSIADYLHEHYTGDIALYQEFEELSALAFYIDKPLLMVDSRSSDLLYGQRLPGDHPTFLTLQQWADMNPRPTLVLLKQRIDDIIAGLHDLHVNLDTVCIRRRFSRVAIIDACN